MVKTPSSMAINPIAIGPQRRVSRLKNKDKNEEMKSRGSKVSKYEKTGEMETIYKPKINKAAAFLVESSIFINLI